MSEQWPPQHDSERYFQPQATYPAQPGPYGPPQQMPGNPMQGDMPQRYQYAYPPYPPQLQYAYPPYPPQLQYQIFVPGPYAQPFNINITYNGIHNGYIAKPYYPDPYRGNAVMALICGIIAILAWLVPFTGSLAAFICAIIALVNGIKGRRSSTRAGSATAGIILSSIALVFLLGELALYLMLFAVVATH